MAPFRPILIALIAAWSVSAQASHEIAFTEAQMQRLGIATGKVVAGSQVQTDSLPARVVIPPGQERVVSAPQGGLVSGLHAAKEEAVAAGDLLAEIHSPELVRMQRDFLQAYSARELAWAARDRDKQLFEEGIIPERRYQEASSRFQQAQANLEAQRQALQIAGMAQADIARLEQTQQLSGHLQVRAPMDGVVVDKPASVGQRLKQAEPLYRVARLDPLWLEIRMPVDRLQGVKKGAPVSVPCASGKAHVALVGRTAAAENQTVTVRARISGGEDCLRPGQFVETRLEVGAGTARFRVPTVAVVRNQGKQWVFVRAAQGFLPVAVTVHGQRGADAVVGGPLRAGQEIAVSGLAAIKGAWSGYGGGE
ncbi:efflux RND transporter periplasmic adaptor subunit [Thiohalorhabdus methylotrophus]|uniref:Efflux RND transporter periplasmic adaptor subunit n=1 Tax=Thiohalorhabdus methylotrophus TaxID=3242694 RepID=A0ABV4TW24_9GAMM